jgi:hypothetical protein
MGIRMRDAFTQRLADLRYEPTEKRVRAVLGGHTVVDSGRAVLVWEPRRVVPSYAVPVGDVRADLVPTGSAPTGSAPTGPGAAGQPAILHPGIPFAVHSTGGEPFAVRVTGRSIRVPTWPGPTSTRCATPRR